MTASDAHLRQKVGHFPGDSLEDRVLGGESGFQGARAFRRANRRHLFDIRIEFCEYLAGIGVDLTDLVELFVEFRKQCFQSFLAH